MKTNFKQFKVNAIASILPGEPIDVMSFSDIFSEKEIQRVALSNGVKQVYAVGKGNSFTTLATQVSEHLLNNTQVDRASIDAIVVVTQTPEFLAPATSAILQGRLELTQDVLAFDINYGCSGYVYGLYQAAMLLNATHCRHVLLIAGDVITPYLKQDDQKRLLFSDAVTASLITKGESSANFMMKTDGLGYQYLMAKEPTPTAVLPDDVFYFMDGAKVMEFVLREVPKMLDDFLQIITWPKDEVGLYGLHQANTFMLEYLRKKANLPSQKTPISMANTGNTGPASIPLMLCQEGDKSRANTSLEKTVLCGFGVGLSWGVVGLNLADTVFYQPINQLGKTTEGEF